ncbi:hypothetical protein D9M72_602550 [compost metagenome]
MRISPAGVPLSAIRLATSSATGAIALVLRTIDSVRMIEEVLMTVAGSRTPADMKLSSTARRSSVPGGWKTQS